MSKRKQFCASLTFFPKTDKNNMLFIPDLKGATLQLFKRLAGLGAAAFGITAFLFLSGATAAQAADPQPATTAAYDLDELQESDYNHLLFDPEDNAEGEDDVEDEDEDDGKKRKRSWVPWVAGGAAGLGILGILYGFYRWFNRGRKAVKGARTVHRHLRNRRRRDGDSDYDGGDDWSDSGDDSGSSSSGD
jgi:hypothetical protein